MNTIFDKDFLNRLEHLSLLTKRLRAGHNSGNRRSPVKGHSVEFADFRSYSAGDDFRYIDWNTYARSNKLFVKLFMEEQDLLLNIFVDSSFSMFGVETSKGVLAKQMTAAFAYLGLSAYERVAIAACSDSLLDYLPPLRGRPSLEKTWAFIDRIQFQGCTDLNQALRAFGPYSRGPGVSLVISDLLSPAGFQEGLKYLQYLQQEIILLQILAPDEIEPKLHGDLRLLDSETGEIREITVSYQLLKAYHAKLHQFTKETKNFCYKRGISFLQVSSNEEFEDIILHSMPRAGILKSFK
ncbi:MAG: DUF58 domain-containing protein [Syntrophomonadaceae bacterium]|nr:DUF58 domain-containing protein [Syntrophomonadaceae bacterium]